MFARCFQKQPFFLLLVSSCNPRLRKNENNQKGVLKTQESVVFSASSLSCCTTYMRTETSAFLNAAPGCESCALLGGMWLGVRNLVS